MAFKIRDGNGVIIGVFQDRADRDTALDKYVSFGFPVDE